MIRVPQLAVGLFTVLPTATGGNPTRAQVRSAILLAPVVGLGLGLIAAAALFGLRQLMELHVQGITTAGALFAAVLTVGFLVALTGGLHWDGLADTVDGIASRRDRPGTLEVMRQPTIGALGALTILVVFSVQVAALTLSLINGHGTVAVVTAVVGGRVAVVWACRGKAARDTGLGAWVAGVVTTRGALLVTAASLLVPLVLLAVDDDPARTAAPWVLAAIPVGIAVTVVLQRWWSRRTGGITGDTIGAGVEIATTVVLICVALAP